MQELNWYLVTVEDEDDAPGSSFIRIIKLIQEVVNFQYVVLWNCWGGGKGIRFLHEAENAGKVLEIDELFHILAEVDQLESGNLYLYRNYPYALLNEDKDSKLKARLSETTVSAIDNTYIYVYTPDINIARCIKENYVLDTLTYGPLDTLGDYPEGIYEI